MYIHIGEEKELLVNKIIGIFDIHSIKNVYQNKTVAIKNISREDIAKSAILVEEDKNMVIYLSPISALTLNKRWTETFK